ncbi:hypothetical protein [Roseivivax sediminis]|uniref:Uncharacterized protein n=1 Tax=Roseivivax sediminis TaxID=936889 RepID=A0A1I1W449_9RHOB|nr:hypothetical protein [Roseivivax sediminis]SFD87750.1 hypothetical protein SAMN04515678_1043 [Roseivivax sediminis]
MDATERSLLAAEAALGLLGPDERASVSRKLSSDPAMRADHTFWTEHFARMLSGIEEVPPRPGVKAGLEERLFGAPDRTLWADLMAPENRGVLALVVGAKIAVLALLLAYFL